MATQRVATQLINKVVTPAARVRQMSAPAWIQRAQESERGLVGMLPPTSEYGR